MPYPLSSVSRPQSVTPAPQFMPVDAAGALVVGATAGGAELTGDSDVAIVGTGLVTTVQTPQDDEPEETLVPVVAE